MCENFQLVELRTSYPGTAGTAGCHIFAEAKNIAWCLAGAGAEARFGGRMQELAPAIAELEKRPDLNLDVALVVGRLACVALCISAVMTGNSLLAWFAVPVLLWTLLVVWGQRVVFLENLNSLPRIAPASDAGPPSGLFPAVSVISPARNEEKGIEPALRSLALQDYPRLEVLAIDDHSTDTTPVILQRLEEELSRVRVLHPPALPAGWAGKPHACWVGFLQSDPAAEWLLFTDARVVFHPHAVRMAVTHAEAERLDFLSGIFRFDGETIAEGLLAAAQSRSLVATARNFRGGLPDVPVGIGAFTLIRRRLYSASGGHSIFRHHPMEDLMLAKLAKYHGAKMSAAIASDLISLRRYHGFADIRKRMPLNLQRGACGRILNLVNRIGIELLLYVSPCCLAVAGLARLMAWHRWEPAFLTFSL
jgi:hypothetical protein